MSAEKQRPHWLSFNSPKEWHNWLLAQHDKNTEIWLRIIKAGSEEAGLKLAEAVMEALCFGWIDGQLLRLDADSYLLHFTPRKSDSVWSKNNKLRAEVLMASGRMTEAGFEKIREAKANGNWDNAYTALIPPELPPDMEEAFKADSTAGDHFRDYCFSDQLMMVFWIEQAKRPQTRQQRMAEVLRMVHDKQKLPW
jgi:uncharacterized protein YdeI (YjbR/CyaY-like superfamily)